MDNSSAAGAVTQLQALGAADAWISAGAKASVWRAVVVKRTHFSFENVTLSPTGASSFGGEVNFTVAKTGDLVRDMYAVITLPAIKAQYCGSGGAATGRFPAVGCNDMSEMKDVDGCAAEEEPWVAYVNAVGYAALEAVALKVGGQTIDLVYGKFMYCYEELSGRAGARMEEMVGRRYSQAELIADSSKERTLRVPIPFWFTQHDTKALQVASMQFHSIGVCAKVAPLASLIQVSSPDVEAVKADGTALQDGDLRMSLELNYVLLSQDERDQLSMNSYVTMIFTNEHQKITGTSRTISEEVVCNNPTREFIFVAQRDSSKTMNNSFDFSGVDNKDPIEHFRLTLNNSNRVSMPGEWFRQVQPLQHHTNIPNGFIYCYSFASQPEGVNPDGSLNFARIDRVRAHFTMQQDLVASGEGYSIYMFFRSINQLSFKRGTATKMFA